MDATAAFRLLVRVETELWNAVDGVLLDEVGLSLGRVESLSVISSTPGCRVQDLATAFSVTVGGVSKSVDRLEEAGLVERQPHPVDRRSSVLTLTPAGEEALARGRSVLERELAARMGALGAGEVEQLAGLLARLRP
ncbi:DNA-binding MarR family transcriptional regulator [Motilibacter rhizosphaerae]|uniref:DNA-binding MarR family transcriptional regulator n=1 Tax=Motilibacter rhizosphaerae TaxID=598652 RepID=A0A4Q7NUT7_9ACTN|nr:MarR family winged helix-turn-helix transcriptional regulator [Motilibacter rhizosphaerae]RZS90895.1 DNA-binding MarR family transcriptional regulator [Motilibacter rhizosphaerae]